jgi:hypothetical protein
LPVYFHQDLMPFFVSYLNYFSAFTGFSLAPLELLKKR